MNISRTLLPVYLALGLFAASCASMQPSAGVRDDVYYMPSDQPVVADAPKQMPAEQPQEEAYSDDYYDPGTAKDLGVSRSYYDMAYNDPYYYNYGRFGFGTGMGMGMGSGMMMGWQTGWSGPGWGMGMGYTSMSMGYGWGNGMYDPWYGGWGNPYMNPYRPMGYYSPYGYYDPYMGGYGWGNYYGPYGNCYSCYAPVVVGGSSGLVVGHRPSVGGSAAQGGSNVEQPRGKSFRDPVGLTPNSRMDDPVSSSPGSVIERSGDRRAPVYRSTDQRPSRQPQIRTGGERGNRQIEQGGGIERGGGGIDRSGGAPSRSGGGGGGSSPVTSPRPR